MAYTARKGLYYPTDNATAHYSDFTTLPAQIDNELDRYRANSGSKFIFNQGIFEDRGPNLPGYIVVNTDIPFGTTAGTSADKMVRFDVRGYTYTAYSNIIDFSVNFYMLSGGIHSPTFHNKGTMHVREVRLCRNNANNTLTLMFASVAPGYADQWHYPKIMVDGWISWGNEIPDAQFNNVYISRVADPFGGTPTHTTVYRIDTAEWKPLPLYNGWYQYDGGGVNGHATARYRKIGEQVYLEGLVVGGPLTGDITGLPFGFKHNGGPLIFTQYGNGGPSRVDVYSNGVVAANNIPSNGYLSLNGITFPASGD